MAIQSVDLKSIKKKYKNLVIENHLGRPETLQKVVYLKSQGLSDTAIGERLGMNRESIANYWIRLQGAESQITAKAIFWAILLLVGFSLLSGKEEKSGK